MLLLYFGPVWFRVRRRSCDTSTCAHTQEFARIFLFSSCNDKKRRRRRVAAVPGGSRAGGPDDVIYSRGVRMFPAGLRLMTRLTAQHTSKGAGVAHTAPAATERQARAHHRQQRSRVLLRLSLYGNMESKKAVLGVVRLITGLIIGPVGIRCGWN
jgi:hypothetical protein